MLDLIEPLGPHPTDDYHLTPDEILDHKSVDTRSILLHPYGTLSITVNLCKTLKFAWNAWIAATIHCWSQLH
jgi:hypothetical protein